MPTPRHSPLPHLAVRHGGAVLASVALACAAVAAEPVPPALQLRLEAAVRDHDAGRLPQAQRAFEALARRGVPAAEADLAVMHLQGEVPRPDPVLARRLLERAAASGFVAAELMLARGHEAGAFGAPRDLPRAHDWYERAALAGSTEAQLEMGTAHYLGRGRPRDAALAARWFLAAARGGDVGAMYLLASLYERGEGAVARDLRLARYWYGAAAALGDVAADGKAAEVDAAMRAETGREGGAPGTPTAPP